MCANGDPRSPRQSWGSVPSGGPSVLGEVLPPLGPPGTELSGCASQAWVPVEETWSYDPEEAEETIALLRRELPEGQMAHLMPPAPGFSRRKPVSREGWLPGI